MCRKPFRDIILKVCCLAATFCRSATLHLNLSNHVCKSPAQNCTNAFLPSLMQLMSALAAVGPPNPREDPECCSILHGLVAAVESLCKITELQHERRTTLMDLADRVANRGRIICLTNAKRYEKTAFKLKLAWLTRPAFYFYFYCCTRIFFKDNNIHKVANLVFITSVISASVWRTKYWLLLAAAASSLLASFPL